MRAVNEPSHIACGAPDFVVARIGLPIGHIECKDIGSVLDRVECDEQIKRYRGEWTDLSGFVGICRNIAIVSV